MADLLARERLIFALDVESKEEAVALVSELKGLVSFYKVGIELLMSLGMEDILRMLIKENQVFVDLKLPGDIGETVRRVVRLSSSMGVKFITLSRTTDAPTVRAAVEGRGTNENPKLLAVSFLSSLDQADYQELYGAPTESFDDYLLARSRMLIGSGCDGLVASGDSVRLLRRAFPDAIIVSPGIRPSGSSPDDHKRFATPSEAIEMGADYLVVGRPIRNASNPRDAAERIIEEIDTAVRGKSQGTQQNHRAADFSDHRRGTSGYSPRPVSFACKPRED